MQDNNNLNTNNNKNNKKTKVMVGVIIFILLLLLCAVIKLGGSNGTSTDPTPDNVVETQTPAPNNNGNGQVFIIDENTVDKNEVAQAQKNPLSGRNVFFAGYADATLNRSSTVALENLPENEEFFMKYVITDKDTGNVVHETNLIPSGRCVVWIPGETLEPGTYNLQFLAMPYYQHSDGNFQQLTSGCNDIVYTIVE